jgi:GTP pyrophosphokinase
VHTGRARHRIRSWLRAEEQKTFITVGQEILERELRRRKHAKLTDGELARAAEALKLNGADHIFASVGQGDITVTQLLKAIYPDLDETETPALKPSALERLIDRMRRPGSSRGLRIQGADGLLVRYAQCCQPVPGDRVVGYVTRGRGVSIHRQDCPNLLHLVHEPERRLEIDWQETAGERFVIRLAIEGNDRRGLYADLATAVSAAGTDIRSLELKTVDGRVSGAALVEVENLAHLDRIIKAARKVKGVTEVARRERLSAEGD